MTMSNEEAKKHAERIHQAATSTLTRPEKLNIRFSEGEIVRLRKVAQRLDTKVMPMLREWVLERLQKEELEPEAAESRAIVAEIVSLAGRLQTIEELKFANKHSKKSENVSKSKKKVK